MAHDPDRLVVVYIMQGNGYQPYTYGGNPSVSTIEAIVWMTYAQMKALANEKPPYLRGKIWGWDYIHGGHWYDRIQIERSESHASRMAARRRE